MAEIDARAYEVASVAQLLTVNNEGDDLANADTDYRLVMAAITEHIGAYGGTATGEVTIKFKIVADAKGVDVAIETTRKMPKRPLSKARYFTTGKGDGLTLRNPNRETMFPGQDLGRRRFGDPS
ncbi:hypothetical protein [Azospirillum sp. Sh1]|uniref:hypothetical protein n=1 Tax=Azospirillum sp. Sh1 TaxID=2607285 RepID=UPI0011EF2054|nr:hypothetical protein [Azospirillum sp. Sh1]KAA0571103.1 hypothetical protein FZ029_28015 [Azospirillum sp. Sh1]